ncbi:predicted protein [Nematostella vectensis]|uniref:Reverse transcriptase/retrotransposon-derived protein RNase H-like domain-containing protein n=1 Tax=Nematostella vectensis TaxID=45351 RepID=A7SHK8_NEMVE|nr:predicted protein [Nematostella vectensis]|eukprot:XP_001628858.1 predicted protein [Nematostella vectensis]
MADESRGEKRQPLKELMCRVLGDLLEEGFVVKIADDLFCGGNTPTELLNNWQRVHDVLYKCNLRLSAAKTVIDRQSTTALGWSGAQALNEAKSALTKNRAITNPRPDDQLWIVTDGAVRKPGIGATLYVTRGEKLHLAGFFIAKLRGGQATWLPCEVEALSIDVATNHFSPFLIQSHHTACILTDSKPCVQAYAKLCRGEFSPSPCVATFLSTASRYQTSVAGAAILPWYIPLRPLNEKLHFFYASHPSLIC